MAYITMMPQDNDLIEIDDSHDVVYFKAEPKKNSEPQPSKNSLNKSPKKPNFQKTMETQQFSDINDQQNKPQEQLKRNEINPNIPIDLTSDIAPSIGKINLESNIIKNLYPYEAYKNNINGWVLLKLFISKAGKVVDVEVLDSSPKGIFEAVAIKAAYKKVFPVNVNNLDPKDYTRNLRTHYNSAQ